MELKPCPFCGGAADIESDGERRYYTVKDGGALPGTREASSWRVGCRTDGCHGWILWGGWYVAPQFAASDWNNRAERTCELSRGTRGLVHVGTGHCSECGAETVKDIDGSRARYCLFCGARVVRQ